MGWGEKKKVTYLVKHCMKCEIKKVTNGGCIVVI